ncbi:MAG: redoxin domain-containing protein, partial [Bacteroidetes bacterium]|nr:redoxin domain-containing protein [Bacteroidota bacterium]
MIKRTIEVLTLALMVLCPIQTVHGQSTSAEPDTTFEKYMRQAWNDIRESEFSDSLQITYSDAFIDYYLENPDSPTGSRALGQAFLLFGNTGYAERLDEVLGSLTYDSSLWRFIVQPLGNVYGRNPDLAYEDYVSYLDYLEQNLSEPRSRSEVLVRLLDDGLRDKRKDQKNIELARELVELNATDWHVQRGLGFLREIQSLNIGQPAPAFEAMTLDGSEISLTDLKENYVLMEFWATWCGPCIPEIPYLKQLHEEFGDKNFRIIGISLDRDKKTLLDFISDREMEWAQIFQEDGWEDDIPRL